MPELNIKLANSIDSCIEEEERVLTCAGVRNIIQNALANLNLSRAPQPDSRQAVVRQDITFDNEDDHLPAGPFPVTESSSLTYNWASGVFQKIPEKFEFVGCSTRELWLLWTMGDHINNVPPLRVCSPVDFGTKNLKKRFSDCKYMMEMIETILKEKGQNLTFESAPVVYDQAHPEIEAD